MRVCRRVSELLRKKFDIHRSIRSTRDAATVISFLLGTDAAQTALHMLRTAEALIRFRT